MIKTVVNTEKRLLQPTDTASYRGALSHLKKAVTKTIDGQFCDMISDFINDISMRVATYFAE